MNWIKAHLKNEMGRSIGQSENEAVFFNPENGLLLIKDGSEPYFSSLGSLTQYKLYPNDETYFNEVINGLEKRPLEVSEVKPEVLVENKKEENNKNKQWFNKK